MLVLLECDGFDAGGASRRLKVVVAGGAAAAFPSVADGRRGAAEETGAAGVEVVCRKCEIQLTEVKPWVMSRRS